MSRFDDRQRPATTVDGNGGAASGGPTWNRLRAVGGQRRDRGDRVDGGRGAGSPQSKVAIAAGGRRSPVASDGAHI